MFNWVNQGGASVTAASKPFLLDPPNSVVSIRGQVKPVPGASYTMEAKLFSLTKQIVNGFGLLLQESSSGKLLTYLWQTEPLPDGGIQYFNYLAKWDDPNTFNSSYGKIAWPGNPPVWMKVVCDGTNLTFFFSEDKINWIPSGTVVPVGDFLTPDNVGYFVYSRNAANPVGVVLEQFSLV